MRLSKGFANKNLNYLNEINIDVELISKIIFSYCVQYDIQISSNSKLIMS